MKRSNNEINIKLYNFLNSLIVLHICVREISQLNIYLIDLTLKIENVGFGTTCEIYMLFVLSNFMCIC